MAKEFAPAKANVIQGAEEISELGLSEGMQALAEEDNEEHQ